MDFFAINTTSNLDIIGYYPQLTFRKGYNPSSPNGYYNVKKDKFPDFSPEYELELDPRAHLVNILPPHPGSNGLLVDEMVRGILKRHCLPPHAFYPMELYHKRNVHRYYWFHYIPDDFWNLLDKENSYVEKVLFQKGIPKLLEKIPILSKEQISMEEGKCIGTELLIWEDCK